MNSCVLVRIFHLESNLFLVRTDPRDLQGRGDTCFEMTFFANNRIAGVNAFHHTNVYRLIFLTGTLTWISQSQLVIASRQIRDLDEAVLDFHQFKIVLYKRIVPQFHKRDIISIRFCNTRRGRQFNLTTYPGMHCPNIGLILSRQRPIFSLISIPVLYCNLNHPSQRTKPNKTIGIRLKLRHYCILKLAFQYFNSHRLPWATLTIFTENL